jgi:TonB family protein
MIIREKYLIIGKVGEGGMGAVYRARHLAFNEIRAIKVVHQSFADDRAFIKRFKTEAIVSRRLQHPNAVRIDDLDSTEDGRPFIVMEMVEGPNLKEVIAGAGFLSVSRSVNIATQAAEALAAAHNLGIVHRDIKPDNILVTHSVLDDNDVIKIVDFGIAKVREGTLDVGDGYTATVNGMIVGTPQYLSPEQALGMHGDQIDGRADIYSLGIVLYIMLTGKLPFESATPMGYLMQHVQTKPIAPDVLRPDLNIPAELTAVLMKALEKDRNDRFATAHDMAMALQSIPRSALQSSQAAARAGRTPAPPTVAAVPSTRSQSVASVLQSSPMPAIQASVAPSAVVASQPLPAVAPQIVPATPPVPKSSSLNPALVIGILVVLLITAVGVFAAFHFLNIKLREQGQPGPASPPVQAVTPSQQPTSATATTAPVSAPDKSAGNAARDASLKGLVEQRLAPLKDSVIQVSVQDGAVTLTGKSPSKADAVNAETFATQVPGVKQVHSDILVAPEQLSADGSASPETPRTGRVTLTPGVMQENVLVMKMPSYPANVDPAQVDGTVRLAVIVSRTGFVQNPRVVSGDSALRQAAIDAVKTWRYRPYMLNGLPVEVETQVNVTFSPNVFAAPNPSAASTAVAAVHGAGVSLLVNGEPSPNFEYTGTCPVDLRFTWKLVSAKPTDVRYILAKSDGSRSSVVSTAQVPKANQPSSIVEGWHMGANTPQFANYPGWINLIVQFPNSFGYRINFNLHCKVPGQ